MAGLLDFLQSASNSAASNASAPVDGLAWLMRKLGAPIPSNPVGGSDWMAEKGLTKPVDQSGYSLAGESAGMIAPMLAVAKAPQIARGLLQGADNLASPQVLSKQAGAIGWYGGDLPPSMQRFANNPNIDANVTDSARGLTLSKVVVPKEARGSGIGSDFMEALTKHADEVGKTTALTPASDFGGTKSRLIEFYKRYGFVPNKGRNMDFAISESMYRTPK